jgi:tripartite-type tricarboxylate transporter receptor subunit TctC
MEKFPSHVKFLSPDFWFKKVFSLRSIGRIAALAGHVAIAGIGMSAALPSAQAADEAADYPNRPIRVVIGFSAGGVVDVSVRIIGQKLAERWKQQVVADNRAGAGGMIAAQIAANANPDGYTLLSISASHTIIPALYAKIPYDTLKDFAGVTTTVMVPNVLVVSPALGVKSAKDLVAMAKAKPLLYSSGGVGSSTHFAAELFMNLAGITVGHVPFKGIPEAMTETMVGRVQFTMSPVSVVMPFVKDGRLLALGVSTVTRAAAMPDVPTLAEAGVTGYRWDPWFAVLVPAKTPRPIVKKLNDEIRRILVLPDVKERWAAMGAEIAPPISLEELDRYIAEQVALVAKLARAANIKPE